MSMLVFVYVSPLLPSSLLTRLDRPYISLYWTLYESFKTSFIPHYDAYRPSPPSSLPSTPYELPLTLKYTLCSVTACSLAASVTNPIELVQSRWQTSAGKGLGEKGVKGIVRELWKQGGVRAFGRGLGIRVAYAVSVVRGGGGRELMKMQIPANGISMTVYESLKRWKGI